jgi:hypothetical protein
VLSLLGWQQVTMIGNTFFGLQNLLFLSRPKEDWDYSDYLIDNNTYLEGDASTPFNLENQSLDFVGWRKAGAFDHHSRWVTSPSGRPTGTKIFIRPNRYELGRANITVYNWDRKSTVQVDLREVLTRDMLYEIRNVLDYDGAPVAAGVYSGAPLTLPLVRNSTGAEFNVFVVESRLRH